MNTRHETESKARLARLERGLDFVTRESAAMAALDPIQRHQLESRASRTRRREDDDLEPG